ncbi:MAG TPA: 2-C-methyl-D-erythritol 4-phosphate cytidylyltransferase [Xanthomonadaceae bacterium]|nr:2-C-methyl-D-erythritol 4-phosphate cytidylyltransferase [Xanthomonadaceae bacterium]
MGRDEVWAIVPAAGRGARFGGDVPKQYLSIAGQPLVGHAIDAVLSDARVAGVVVAVAPDDTRWPGWTRRQGKPVVTSMGGGERADSVLAALQALPAGVPDDALLLVHDAARPNLHPGDLSRLVDAALDCPDGALLAAPVRDTLKHADADGRSAGTEPRDTLWRALTPQAFRRDLLREALLRARAEGVVATDEAMAVERLGRHPRLVEGRDDNLKVTTPADLALADYLVVARLGRPVP